MEMKKFTLIALTLFYYSCTPKPKPELTFKIFQECAESVLKRTNEQNVLPTPFVALSILQNSNKRDGWGTPIEFEVNSGRPELLMLRVISSGGDKKKDTADDIFGNYTISRGTNGNWSLVTGEYGYIKGALEASKARHRKKALR